MSGESLKSNNVYFEFSTKDAENLRKFYEVKLGFPVFPPQPLTAYLQVKIGDNKLVGFRRTDREPDKCSLYIHVDDVEEAHRVLKERGLTPSLVSSELWGHPATVICDPEGRLLAFTKESDSPAASV